LSINTPNNPQQKKNEWLTEDRVIEYLDRADRLPHRLEGESVLLEHIPVGTNRILDLGTGNGRLIRLLKNNNKNLNIVEAIGLDFSSLMIKKAREEFSKDPSVKIIEHDLNNSLFPKLNCEKFDVVVSSFAIHHLEHQRKLALYKEIFSILNSGGIFCNLDHVSSPSPQLHKRFMAMLGKTPETEDSSNRLLDLHTQLEWLKTIGFIDVDCYWKWLEFALLIGVKP
jgi:tRNA (cmo5U34)-methyltransferase